MKSDDRLFWGGMAVIGAFAMIAIGHTVIWEHPHPPGEHFRLLTALIPK